MIGAVREKLQNVQQDFSQGIQRLKQTTSTIRLNTDYLSSSRSDVASTSVQAILHPNAGAHVLHHFECGWRKLRVGGDGCCEAADECSAQLLRAQRNARAAANNLMQMHSQLAHTPRMSDALTQLMADCDDLQSACVEVESALSHLEVICETQRFQERKLDSKFELALYTEQKMAEMSERKEALVKHYDQQKKARRQIHDTQKKDKQQVCEEAFQNDLQLFKTQGLVANVIHDTELVSPTNDREDVDIYIEDEPEIDVNDLEQFLADVKLEDSGIAGSEGQEDEEEGQSTL